MLKKKKKWHKALAGETIKSAAVLHPPLADGFEGSNSWPNKFCRRVLLNSTKVEIQPIKLQRWRGRGGDLENDIDASVGSWNDC